MIDHKSTSLEWQTHTGDIIVSGVGALEQHGSALPVGTDSIKTEYFARAFAEKLDAALLPVISIASSLEHRGFRGSMSLRPETLMSIIRDLADELEAQNWKYWVIVNGHGGNYFLNPVVRDINSRDGSLKIIPVNSWEFCPDSLESPADPGAADLHAGDYETSVMLHLYPELVGDKPEDSKPDTSAWPLKQSDLNIFGIGSFNPAGFVGSASMASAEKGSKMVVETCDKAVAYIRNRIARLEKMPRYAGRGGLAVRPMLAKDLPDCMRLKEIANWNQLIADWQLFLELDKEGNFVMVANGLVVGTVTTVAYEGKTSWIGMVLVDPNYRRMGIATRLMNEAVEYLEKICDGIKLDATPDGREVYRRIGFVDEFRIGRFICKSVPVMDKVEGIAKTDPDMLENISNYDKEIFGADRQQVIARLLRDGGENSLIQLDGEKITGAALGRAGHNYYQIGPVMADSEDIAVKLISATLHNLAGQGAVIDVPLEGFEKVESLLSRAGFRMEREFIRMYRGENTAPADLTRYFAIAGPELG